MMKVIVIALFCIATITALGNDNGVTVGSENNGTTKVGTEAKIVVETKKDGTAETAETENDEEKSGVIDRLITEEEKKIDKNNQTAFDKHKECLSNTKQTKEDCLKIFFKDYSLQNLKAEKKIISKQIIKFAEAFLPKCDTEDDKGICIDEALKESDLCEEAKEFFNSIIYLLKTQHLFEDQMNKAKEEYNRTHDAFVENGKTIWKLNEVGKQELEEFFKKKTVDMSEEEKENYYIDYSEEKIRNIKVDEKIKARNAEEAKWYNCDEKSKNCVYSVEGIKQITENMQNYIKELYNEAYTGKTDADVSVLDYGKYFTVDAENGIQLKEAANKLLNTVNEKRAQKYIDALHHEANSDDKSQVDYKKYFTIHEKGIEFHQGAMDELFKKVEAKRNEKFQTCKENAENLFVCLFPDYADEIQQYRSKIEELFNGKKLEVIKEEDVEKIDKEPFNKLFREIRNSKVDPIKEEEVTNEGN